MQPMTPLNKFLISNHIDYTYSSNDGIVDKIVIHNSDIGNTDFHQIMKICKENNFHPTLIKRNRLRITLIKDKK